MMTQKVMMILTDEEYAALCEDSDLNIRVAQDHIRYLIKFHLLGYRDMKIDQLRSKIDDLASELRNASDAMIKAEGRIASARADIAVLAVELKSLVGELLSK